MIVYYGGLGAAKLSILFRYLELFTTGSPGRRKKAIAIMVAVSSGSVGLLLMATLACDPAEEAGGGGGGGGGGLRSICLPMRQHVYIDAVGDIVSDSKSPEPFISLLVELAEKKESSLHGETMLLWKSASTNQRSIRQL